MTATKTTVSITTTATDLNVADSYAIHMLKIKLANNDGKLVIVS